MTEEAAKAEGTAPESAEEKQSVSRVKGLTDAQFDGVGIRTLEAWKKYWSDAEKYGKDGHDEAKAKADLEVIDREIEARRKQQDEQKAAREAKAAGEGESASAPAGDASKSAPAQPAAKQS
jgi:hypothetical protein